VVAIVSIIDGPSRRILDPKCGVAASTFKRLSTGTDMLQWTEYLSFAISLLAVLTPFAVVPLFLSLTEGLPSSECSRIATVAAVTAASVLVVAAMLGQPVLAALGTSIGSLRVGGGLVLLLMTFSTFPLHHVPSHGAPELGHNKVVDRSSDAVVPLGLPLLAGPAPISAVMGEMHKGTGLCHDALVTFCILSTCAATWALLRLAQPIGSRFGSNGLIIISRLLALLSAATAVEIITSGLHALFPVLG
jgi:multiple antibiotic resistance protein